MILLIHILLLCQLDCNNQPYELVNNNYNIVIMGGAVESRAGV